MSVSRGAGALPAGARPSLDLQAALLWRCLPKETKGVVAAGSSYLGECSPEACVWVIRLFLEKLWKILKSPKEKVQLF